MKLTWLGHACYLMESRDGSIVFDAYEPGYVPGVSLPPLAADMCLSSHLHRDHHYPEAVKLTRRMTGFKLRELESFHDDCGGEKRGKNTIHIVDAEGLRLVHLGDLGHMPDAEQLEALGRVDILLVPVGGFYTIDAKTAFELVEALKPVLTIPMHYRGEGFGYDVIAPVEDFASLFNNVRYADSNVLDTENGLEPGVLVLKCPVV